MRERLEWGARFSVPELYRVYRERYRGSESDPRFDPHSENEILARVELELPHLLSLTDVQKAEASRVLERALRRAFSELSCLAADWYDDNGDLTKRAMVGAPPNRLDSPPPSATIEPSDAP